jgi:fatty-acyl-CoA synthase
VLSRLDKLKRHDIGIRTGLSLDPYRVEKVHALVVTRQGASATAEEIIDFCKKNIAGYKTPKSVEFLDSLPKNPAGKILKRELREKYWKEADKKA